MPSAVRQRSASPDGRSAKKARDDPAKPIVLPEGTERVALNNKYEASEPYKHIVVPGLLTDELVSRSGNCDG
jgi:hypothetical protein